MPRLRGFVALLLLVLWTPVVSHCLLEAAIGTGEHGCCESGDHSGPETPPVHSDCIACISIEQGQLKTERTLLPAPQLLPFTPEIRQALAPSDATAGPIANLIRSSSDPPPVPPAIPIGQALIGQPVRGPSQAA